MARTLKRRSEAISRDTSPSESTTQEPRNQRQRSETVNSSPAGSEKSLSDQEESQSQATNQIFTLTKKLVRLALATEYTRTPLRRTDISTKIFKDSKNTATSRSFKIIFDEAQKILNNTFGMNLVELPSKEKTSLKDRRQQVTSQSKSNNNSSKSWILISTLPTKYRTNTKIIQPSRAPSSEVEAGYTGLYTFIVSLIYLNSWAISEQKLSRYLKRVNAENFTPLGSTEKLLQRMTKEGYLEKRRDTTSGEELIEWVVGPRGKVEVGTDGVVGLVRSVYGFDGKTNINGNADDGGEEGSVRRKKKEEEEQDLEARLSRSLGITVVSRRKDDNDDNGDNGNVGELEETRTVVESEPRKSTRTRARRRDNNDDDDSE